MSFRNVEKAIVNPISIELDIFADILTLKYEVINEETSDLMEEYSNYENFQEFITTVNNLIGFESVFFMLNDSFIEKILKILNYGKYKFAPKFTKLINETIISLNEIKCTSENVRNLKLNAYLSYQEDIRKTTFIDNESFITSLGFDAIALAAIINKDYDEINNKELFIKSLNYLIDTVPDLFKDNNVYNNTNEILNSYVDESSIFDFKFKKKIKLLKKDIALSTKKDY